MLKFLELKFIDPKRTKKEVYKQLDFSHSTIKQYRDDINLGSPYSRNKYRKKNNKSSTLVTQTHTPNGKIKNTKNIKRNVLKVGSVLIKNHQEENFEFITIARKMVDNV